MRDERGTDLVQYVIPTALIGIIVGIALFASVGDGLILKFSSASINADDNSGELIVNEYNKEAPIAPGDLGGTEVNPRVSCGLGSLCTVDYGDYVVFNVPMLEGLNTILSTAGSSGMVGSLSNVFKHLSDSLRDNGEEDAADDLEQMANLGKLLSSIENNVEQITDACPPGDSACLLAEYQSNSYNPALPSSLSGVLTSYNSSGTLQDLANNQQLGQARYDKIHNPATFNALKTSHPSYAMIDLFDSINSNPSYSDEIKSITAALLAEINKASTYQRNTVEGLIDDVNDINTDLYDINSGLVDDTYTLLAGDNDFDLLLHPSGVELINLTDALTCIGGKDFEAAKACY